MSQQGRSKQVCYYELLAVDRKCAVAEIKQSYRKLALQMHPDKAHINGISVEEATRKFQQIQEAYSVLSDPQERTWYDSHREQILRGDDEAGEDPFKTKINLFKHFSTSCFDGFTDKDGGFFAVYGDLFQAINQEEAEWDDADEDHIDMPAFGDSKSEYVDVSRFYKHWLEFCSRKAFGFADKWNPKDATSRQVRRAMEQENKKARQAAKKDFNSEVRQLVKFVQKRDPRVVAYQKQQMKESMEKTKVESAQREARKAAEVQARQQRKEAARIEEEERWQQARAERDARRARGELVSEDEETEEEEESVEWCCEACRKSFKSEKALDQHFKSKKHLQLVAKLRRRLAEEDVEEDENGASDESADLEAGDASPHQAPLSFRPPVRQAPAVSEQQSDRCTTPVPPATKKASEETEEDDDEDDDEDGDDLLARLAATKRQGAGVANFKDAEAETGTEDDEEVGDRTHAKHEDSGGSKRQMKKEKHKNILLEKRAEKEHVQSLVNATKKAAKTEKNGAEVLEEQKVVATPAVARNGKKNNANASSDADARCSVCAEEFPSRTKLFQHIRESGHAALKEPPLEAAAGKSRKKKR